MQCNRCWSEDGVRIDDDGHALCSPCRAIRPRDPLIRGSLFLPFASRKELLQHYHVKDSTAALRQWADENQLSLRDAVDRLVQDPGAMALFGREAVLQLRPKARSIPYGYDKQDDALVPDSEEAAHVTAFFRMYQAGMSLRQIAEVANRQGLPTSRGGQWQASTLRHMLRNPIYVGRVRRNGMVREGGPPALIHPQLFETVQNGLTRRGKRARKPIPDGPLAPSV